MALICVSIIDSGDIDIYKETFIYFCKTAYTFKKLFHDILNW